MSQTLLARISAGLEEARSNDRLRSLETRHAAQGPTVSIDGRALLNFSSNDYLGLAADPRVCERVRKELATCGFGAGSAALLSGRSSLHAELERELATYTGFEAGLMFSSGYLANLGALQALISKRDFVAHDRLNHASLIDGVVGSGAQHQRYPHLGRPGFDSASAKAADQRWLVTESLFSMDGDSPDLAGLSACAGEADAVLYVDDAHGIGVLNGGRGAAAELHGSGAPVTLMMATLGKALGSVGAVVLAPRPLIDWLVQRARTFVYDTALPPVCAAAALEALAIMRSSPRLHERLQANIEHFRTAATAAGLPITASTSPIQPVMLGDDARAVMVAQALDEAGIHARAIRPPTVPRGSARLRVTLTSAHRAEDITRLVAVIAATLQPAGGSNG